MRTELIIHTDGGIGFHKRDPPLPRALAHGEAVRETNTANIAAQRWRALHRHNAL